jgi:hypothetical protein
MKYLKLKNNNWVEITTNKVDTKNEETKLVTTTIENVESKAPKEEVKKAQDKYNTLKVKDNKDFELISAVYIGENINKLSVEYNLSGEYNQTFI